MNREDFKQLAEIRLKEAQGLQQAGLFDGAYYVAGYAVECALKAWICKHTKEFDFPPAASLKDTHFTHDLKKLRNTADSTNRFDQDAPAGSKILTNWNILKGWNEESRYIMGRQQGEVTALIDAINDSQDGVLTWIMKYW